MTSSHVGTWPRLQKFLHKVSFAIAIQHTLIEQYCPWIEHCIARIMFHWMFACQHIFVIYTILSWSTV